MVRSKGRLTQEQAEFLSMQLSSGMIKTPEEYDLCMSNIRFVNEGDQKHEGGNKAYKS